MPRPVDSRLRGNDGPVGWYCLVSPSDPVSSAGTGFDSSPIKGEGDRWSVLSCCHPALPLWIADQVRNDGADGRNDARCVPALWILP